MSTFTHRSSARRADVGSGRDHQRPRRDPRPQLLNGTGRTAAASDVLASSFILRESRLPPPLTADRRRPLPLELVPVVHRGRGPGQSSATGLAWATLRSVNAVSVFGVCALTFMMVIYAFERRHPGFVAAFAVGCLFSSAYGFLSGALPFGVVEAIWAVVACRRLLAFRSGGQGPAAFPDAPAARRAAPSPQKNPGGSRGNRAEPGGR